MTRHVGVSVSVVTAAIPIAALLIFMGASEWRLRSNPESVPFAAPIPEGMAATARGEHLARTRGCFSCHGSRLEGKDWSDEWVGIGHVIAPNLARYAREETPEVIERALRHGVGRSGRALWSMPSYNFVHLSDDDVAALIAFLRAHPVLGDSLGRVRTSLEVRWRATLGGESDIAEWVTWVPPMVTDTSRDPASVVRGEYIAMTTCNECHGLDVRGLRMGSDTAPDLAVVASYTREEFGRLMHDGTSRTGDSAIPLMSITARNRFVHFTGAEVDDLYAFLRTLPSRPVATGVPWRDTP